LGRKPSTTRRIGTRQITRRRFNTPSAKVDVAAHKKRRFSSAESDREEKNEIASVDNDAKSIKIWKIYHEEGNKEMEDVEEEEDDKEGDDEVEEKDLDIEIQNFKVEGDLKNDNTEIQGDGIEKVDDRDAEEEDSTDDDVEFENVRSMNSSVPDLSRAGNSSGSVPDVEERELPTTPSKPSRRNIENPRRSLTRTRIPALPPKSISAPSVSNRHDNHHRVMTLQKSHGGRNRPGQRRIFGRK
jgi:hypothetical protein